MENMHFKSFVVDVNDGKLIRRIKERTIDSLPAGEVLIRVQYSALNYKDALSASGNRGITRQYPHTPGIDAAGIVEESSISDFKKGDNVLVTGYDLGMNTSGGFSQFVRVPAGWVVKIPGNLTVRESMIYGTHGFTAGLSVYEIERNDISPDKGKILVTGATGGVGCMSVGILSKIGYEVTASTGKSDKEDFLGMLGANEIISREEADDISGKPLLARKWAGAVDTVGGNTLSSVIRSMDYFGVVACCGNVSSHELHTTVYPFILRGVRLIGINSAEHPMDIRKEIWNRLANEWKINNLDKIYKEIRLEELDDEITVILKGGQVGKVLINCE